MFNSLVIAKLQDIVIIRFTVSGSRFSADTPRKPLPEYSYLSLT